MLKNQEPRTPDAIRAKAKQHFDYLAERPYLFGMTAEQGAEQTRLGMLLVEEALRLPAGGVFDIGDWFEIHAKDDESKKRALGVMPFLMGSMRLFDWEFVHKEVGVLPTPEVRVLLENKTHTYQGVELTSENVFVQYRRLAG